MRILFSLLLFITCTFSQSFRTTGSDLLMGIGAGDISRAGASTASTKDLYSIYWNPAGLVEMEGLNISFSRQLDSTYLYDHFIALSYTFPIDSLGLKVASAFAYIPRLYVYGNGTFYNDDFETLFLKYTLPGLEGDFSGEITSYTYDLRFAAAVAPIENDRLWSFGLSVGYINCSTTFGGVTLADPSNYRSQSTTAKAISLNLGGKYYINDQLNIALGLKNIGSTLAIETEKTYQNLTTKETRDAEFPLDFSGGVSWDIDEDISVAMDYQRLFGTYSTYYIDFRFLRMGGTYKLSPIDYHFGAVVPLYLYSDKLSTNEFDYPFSPTLGFSWHKDNLLITTAFYIHPIMSIYKDAPSPTLDLSISYHF